MAIDAVALDAQVWKTKDRKYINAIKTVVNGELYTISPCTYMYAFYLVPLESDLKPQLIAGLLSNSGLGDKRVFIVINNILKQA